MSVTSYRTAGATEPVPILGAAIPDPFPLKYRGQYQRLTASVFQPLNLLGGLEPRQGGLSRRTNLSLEEALTDPQFDLQLEGRLGEKWNVHLRGLMEDNPISFGAGASCALIEGRSDDPMELGLVRAYVLSLGAEAAYSRGSGRPEWAMEGETLSVHVTTGVHLLKRVNAFGGWGEQGGAYSVRLRTEEDEGTDRFFLRWGGPFAGVAYEGKHVGVAYQAQAALVGGLSPIVPLQAVSIFLQF